MFEEVQHPLDLLNLQQADHMAHLPGHFNYRRDADAPAFQVLRIELHQLKEFGDVRFQSDFTRHGKIGIHDGKAPKFLALALQLAGNCMGYQASHGHTNHIIRTVRLNLTNGSGVVPGHFFNVRWKRAFRIDSHRLDTIDWPVGSEFANQSSISPTQTGPAMQTEERRSEEHTSEL